VGLHLVVVEGKAALPYEEISKLVDREGRFKGGPAWAGVRYFFGREAQRQLRREIEAQFARFAATGLELAHVDGHLHMHLHPTVLKMVLPLARRYGARGVRVARDDLWLGLRFDRREALAKAARAAALGLLSCWAMPRLQASGLAFPRRTYGLVQSGQMTEAYLADLLEQISDFPAEIYFHPTTGRRLDPLGPNPEELQALLSPRVRRIVGERRLRLANYATLEGARVRS
jgi:hopanoid biosynthesis associated protein HpnK